MKMIIPFLAMFLVFVATATAFSTPMPISLKIDNDGPLSGYEVKQTNMRTEVTVTLVTDGNGFVLHDWSNTGWQSGDVIKTEIIDCVHLSECTVETTIDSKGSPIFFTVDLKGKFYPVCKECATCPECPTPEKCPDCVCPPSELCPVDTTPYANCDICCPTDTSPYSECDSCCEVIDNTWLGVGVGVVIGLVVAIVAFMGGGFKIYKNKFGNVTFQHKHKGIVEYHDPSILHKDPKYKHRLWKNDPLGCVKDVAKIESGGLV